MIWLQLERLNSNSHGEVNRKKLVQSLKISNTAEASNVEDVEHVGYLKKKAAVLDA